MHFALRGYLFIVLTALLGVAGTWSDEPAFATAWLFPAFVLLAGLALEAWYQRGTRLAVHMHVESRTQAGQAGRRRLRLRAQPRARAEDPVRARAARRDPPDGRGAGDRPATRR